MTWINILVLQGLFKNTADNPVVLDDSGPAGSQPSQEEVVHDQGKTETTEKKGKKAVPRKKVTKPEEKKKKSAKQNERKTMKQNERKTVKQDEKKSAKKKEKVEDFGQTNASQTLQLEEEEEIEQLIAQGTVVGEEEDIKMDNVYDESSSEGSFNSSDERMALDSSDEVDSTYPEFNETTGMDDPQFRMGMVFASGEIFRAAVRKHAIVHQRPIRLRKNLKEKIKWVCSGGCEWKCYGLKMQRSENIQIKTICNEHTCNPTWFHKCINSTWIAKEYEDEIRMNPRWET